MLKGIYKRRLENQNNYRMMQLTYHYFQKLVVNVKYGR